MRDHLSFAMRNKKQLEADVLNESTQNKLHSNQNFLFSVFA
jgi:hypothetical protein